MISLNRSIYFKMRGYLHDTMKDVMSGLNTYGSGMILQNGESH